MKKYTAGFLFTDNKDMIMLIEKNRPDWQKGKLNGIGGVIEEGETPLECMIREFKEETNVEIKDWELYCTLTDDETWTVYFFRSFKPSSIVDQCRTVTDENVIGVSLKYNLPSNTIENLKWLIPLALSKDNSIPLYAIENMYDDKSFIGGNSKNAT